LDHQKFDLFHRSWRARYTLSHISFWLIDLTYITRML
jgi:hypothetical protein